MELREERAWQESLLADVEALETGIWQCLSHIEELKRDTEALEERVRDFLKEYYGEIGECSQKLDALEAELDAAAFRIQTLRQGRLGAGGIVREHRQADRVRESDARPSGFAFDLDREMRRVYRALAKRCHPDSPLMTHDSALFPDIAEAYARRDLPRLKKLERQLMPAPERADGGEGIEQIALQLERLRETKSAYQRKKKLLQEHPALALRSRALAARLDGEDFYGKLRQWFSRRIRETEAELYARRRELARLEEEKREESLELL